MKRTVTPEQLAKKTRDKFTFYLTVEHVQYLKERAGKAGVSTSEVIDAAIKAYIGAIKRSSKKP